jgi:hypothetical protein
MFSLTLAHSNIWNNIVKLFLKHPVSRIQGVSRRACIKDKGRKEAREKK